MKVGKHARLQALAGIVGRGTAKCRARRAVVAVTTVAATGLAAFAFTAAVGGAAVAAVTPQTTQGTDFWLTFEGNYDGNSTLYLFAAGDTATSGTVSEPAISFSQPFTVTPGTVTQVIVPSNGQDLTSDTVGSYGIHLTAGAPVSVYGLNTEQFTTDGFLGLPTDILGQHYIVEAYSGGGGSQFSVVGTTDGTNVTIVPNETIGSHAAGTPYTVQLNQGQTYQLHDSSGGDLTGTEVTSDKPVAVFGGNNCADVPVGSSACNTLTEELTPVTAWGTSFVTEPLATRSADSFRFLASADNTTVKVNGATVATLNAHAFFETTLSAASVVTSDKPISVTQFSNGSSYDNASADPFSVTVPPYGQFLNSYTVTTEPNGADPAITTNYINVVAPASEVGSVMLDGTAIPASDFSAIPGSSFSGAQVAVSFGSHVLGGPLPFGITVYGFGNYDGYGYPGGFSLSPIAVVSKVALSLGGGGTAPVGGTATATATVTDQNGNPVQGVRVDFTVTGANAQTGFAYTDASGHAVFTYTGKNVGSDRITAAVQSIMSSPVTWTWTQLTPTTITTQLSAGTTTGASITVPAGTAVTDSATLSGANAARATGSVVYNVYSDNACTKLVKGGAAEKISTAGTLPKSAAVTLAAASTYYWTASYSGDAINLKSVSKCGSEKLTVMPLPATDTMTTAVGKSAATAKVTTTVAGDLLVALVAGRGPSGAQTATVSGGGVTWHFAGRENVGRGDVEVWTATAGGVLNGVSVKATAKTSGFTVTMTVVAVKHAVAAGALAKAAAASGAPKVTLKTAHNDAWVLAMADDSAHAVTPKPAAGQFVVSRVADSTDTLWAQATSQLVVTAGTSVTISDSTPTADPWDLIVVEVY